MLLLTEKEGVTARQISCMNPKMCVPPSAGKEQGPCHSFVNNTGIFFIIVPGVGTLQLQLLKKIFIDVGFVVPPRLEPS